MMNTPIICPITGLDAIQIEPYLYRIEQEYDTIIIQLSARFDVIKSKKEFQDNKHILAGAILNKQNPKKVEGSLYHYSIMLEDFEKTISQIAYPKTPQSKLDILLKEFYQLQSFEGDKIQVFDKFKDPNFYYKHYFRSKQECAYYIELLHNKGFINCRFQDGSNMPIDLTLTLEGLEHYIDITEKGQLSNKCFIAMSFSEDMKEIRSAIKKTIDNNGFEPILIDEQHPNSDQTINDAIISEIKACKFCIADFTQQKDGVYFESGYAVGLGKPVIYTCRQDWFEKTHFDTNHFPHIIYNTLEELQEKLELKIKAWIK